MAFLMLIAHVPPKAPIRRLTPTMKLQARQVIYPQHPSSIQNKSSELNHSSQLKASSSSSSSSSSSNPTSFFSRIFSDLCDALEELVNSLKPPLLDTHLAFNFLPLVHESPPTPCTHIEGTIPPALDGVFLRNGSNPLHLPKAGYHYFDGAGMIHSVKIRNGHAVHACRFTRTNRYILEEAAGQPLFINALGELNGFEGIAKIVILLLRHALGLLDLLQGFGPANAGLVYFDGKVLAMSEDDMPYLVSISNDGDIHTRGRFNFLGKLKSSMTAHPKVDPNTGEMFSFSYNVLVPPYLKFFMVKPNGEKMKDVSITVKEPTLMHDFAITESYAVFHENQIVFRMYNMLIGGPPIVCDTGKVPRVGIIPRYDTNEGNMRWFECPTSFGNCLHFLNAWEEGDEVVMVGSVIQPMELIFALKYKELETIQCRLTEFRFNLKSGRVTCEQVSCANIDVGRINEKYVGRKTRYAYLCTSGPWPKYSGVCKVDLEAPRVSKMSEGQSGVNTNEPCIAGWRTFGEGCYGSEPFFVPSSSHPSLQEDDGFLVTFVHNETTEHSQLLIMDAQSPELAIVASISMPCRVPYGFHSLFVSDPHH